MPVYPFRKIEDAFATGDTAATAKAKGDALEEAICLCLASISGITVVARNVVADTGSQEIDVTLWSERHAKAVPFFDHVILVECKNWDAPVGSKAIRDFIGKVRGANVKAGILVASNGITGNGADATAGHDVIRQAFDKDGIMIFVLTRESMLAFRTQDDVIKHMRDIFQRILLRKNPY